MPLTPAATTVRPFAVYQQESYALPKWVTKPSVWERAIEIFHGPILDDDRAFIHRDFYPGNVLWQRKMVSGLVDWEAASVGPHSMDVAHCRINLLYQGLETAELFTREWEHTTGRRVPSLGRHRHDHRAARLPTPQPASPPQTVRPRSHVAPRRQRNRCPVEGRAQNNRRSARRTHAITGMNAPIAGDLRGPRFSALDRDAALEFGSTSTTMSGRAKGDRCDRLPTARRLPQTESCGGLRVPAGLRPPVPRGSPPSDTQESPAQDL